MWEAIKANQRRSAALIFLMAGLLIGMGYVIGAAIDPALGRFGVLIALGLWLVLLLVAKAGGREIMLASVGAREIQKSDHPRLFNIVEEMSIAAGLPKMPRVYIMDTDAPNAFAVGTPDNAAVAATTGLLMRLNRDELQGVMAHEIGHVNNRDTSFMTLAGVMVAAIVLIADMFLRTMWMTGGSRRRSSSRGGGGQAQALFLVLAIVLAILAPIAARLLYLACSRRREYLADACAARFTRYPEGLASALEKIEAHAAEMRNFNRVAAPMCIINPLRGATAASLFSTHPPTKDRVRILRSMSGGAGYAAYEAAYRRVTRERGLIGRSALKSSGDAPLRSAASEDEAPLVRAREAVDIIHRMDGLKVLPCACGAKLKVPAAYRGRTLPCPLCGRSLQA